MKSTAIFGAIQITENTEEDKNKIKYISDLKSNLFNLKCES